PRVTGTAGEAGRGLEDVPAAGRRTVDREVALAIAVVVAAHRLVAGRSPLIRARRREVGTGQEDEPVAGRWPIDRDVDLAIAVIVTRHGLVAGGSPGVAGAAREIGRGAQRIPAAVRRTINRDVALHVAIEVGGDRLRDADAAGHLDGRRALDIRQAVSANDEVVC